VHVYVCVNMFMYVRVCFECVCTTDGEDRTYNNFDCQIFQHVFPGFPVHIKHVFLGSPQNFKQIFPWVSKDLPENRVDLDIQIFSWSKYFAWSLHTRQTLLKYSYLYNDMYTNIHISTIMCTQYAYRCNYIYIYIYDLDVNAHQAGTETCVSL